MGLRGMLVREILSAKGADVVSIQPNAPIAEAAQLLKQHRIGAVIVVDADGGLRGIISERDLARGLAERGAKFLESRIAEWMTEDPVTCTPEEPVDQLMHTMTTRRFRHLPVLEDDKVVGIVSIGDVVKHRLHQLETESHQLQDYIVGESADEPRSPST